MELQILPIYKSGFPNSPSLSLIAHQMNVKVASMAKASKALKRVGLPTETWEIVMCTTHIVWYGMSLCWHLKTQISEMWGLCKVYATKMAFLKTLTYWMFPLNWMISNVLICNTINLLFQYYFSMSFMSELVLPYTITYIIQTPYSIFYATRLCFSNWS